ncbi:MAG: hypothetical protein KBT03_02850 [Bacteroidales bacterium]|nr:hypothetical protein [Candidatus Scybalousia scybalohippi]
MINDYIYYTENAYGKVFCHYDRNETFEWYERNNGTKIWSQTKDLFPEIKVIVDEPNVDIENIREDDTLNKSTPNHRKSVAKYDSVNTKQFKLKLNLKTDEAIIEKLKSLDNVQGYIKNLILNDIANNN